MEPLLGDPEVDEIMVNGTGTGSVWVERRGRLERVDAAFQTEADLRHAIERILAPLGRRADEAQPLADARMADGSRVNVVLPPLAVDGPILTIRRFRPRGLGPDALVAGGKARRRTATTSGRRLAQGSSAAATVEGAPRTRWQRPPDRDEPHHPLPG